MFQHIPLTRLTIFSIAVGLVVACGPTASYEVRTGSDGDYSYEYVTGDAMNTRIYTLDNGLKVYLSDYENAPRMHVFIPVKAGGKNDPAENTGLAHYLEHMMFKGNDKFGTQNFEEEKVMLDSIEQMFNHYATLTNAEERKDYYREIDQYSNKAAELAIANEYDKMIAMLGGKGLNAYTTEDRTVYTVDIPSNELPRFLELEGSRFRQIVNRLFHTELEAVYEEKNRSLDNDYWKSYETLYSGVFEQHPYGTQTVIGTIDHLKNPSITEIKKYFNTYYRPNNVAICISGDIEYAQTIKLIDQYFGDWEPNDDLPEWTKIEEQPIASPKEYEVWGPDAEFLFMGYRFDGTSSEDYTKIRLVDMLLNNAEAGLIDLNLKQKQEVLNAGSFVNNMNDYSIHMFYGYAKQNQSLEEIKNLLTQQIELLKNGEFEDWLVDAVISDFKSSEMKSLESNWSRANKMVMAFTNGMEWSDYIQQIDKMEAITREEIIQFVKENYNDNNVIVYKRNGEDPNKQQVEKPAITKVPLNRDSKSDFHVALAAREIDKLQPRFINYNEDITTLNVNNVEVLALQNTENELFELRYLLDFGKNADKKLAIAVQYLEFLGTNDYSAEELKKEFYKLGCSYSVFASTERTYVTLTGLDEKMEKAATLFESLLANPVPDEEALAKMVDRTMKARSDAKKQKGTILWEGLYNYGKYGAKNPFNDVLKNYELEELSAAELTDIIKGITKLPHRILYYGPRNSNELEAFLNEYHPTPSEFNAMPAVVNYEELDIDQQKVYWADYDMVQAEIIFLAKGEKYDPAMAPEARMFNQYFGGGMNSIVFQEIREAQGLAYAVFSGFREPSRKDDSNYIMAYVGTQADKQEDAMGAMMDLLNDLPESEESFKIAKEAILNKIESERITRTGVLWNYVNAQDKGLDHDIRETIYRDVQNLEFENIKAFHEKYIKDNKYVTVLVGSNEQLDFEALKEYGEVTELSLEELFGYEDSEVISSLE